MPENSSFPSSDAQMSKDVKKNIFKFFPNRKCQTLCTPVEDSSNLGAALPRVAYDDLQHDFRALFQKFQSDIYKYIPLTYRRI